MKISEFPVSYSNEWSCLIPLFTLANDDDEGGAGGDDSVNVIDIVDAFRLKEIEMDKKTWGAYVKGKC